MITGLCPSPLAATVSRVDNCSYCNTNRASDVSGPPSGSPLTSRTDSDDSGWNAKREEFHALIQVAGRRCRRPGPHGRRIVGLRGHHRLFAGRRRGRLAPGLFQGHAGRGEEGGHRPQIRRRPGQGRRAAQGGSLVHRPEGRRDHHRAGRRHRLGSGSRRSQEGRHPGFPCRSRRRHGG